MTALNSATVREEAEQDVAVAAESAVESSNEQGTGMKRDEKTKQECI